MTKKELIGRIAAETGIHQTSVQTVVQKMLDHIIDGLADGETVEFRNFGVFEVRTTKARVGRNPKNPQETVSIPERKTVKFKAGKIMRQALAKPRKPVEASGDGRSGLLGSAWPKESVLSAMPPDPSERN